jgi:hypothetical protein
MAGNNYNIDFTNFGLDDNTAFLYDPVLYIKEFGTLDATLEAIGYMELEKSFKGKIEYAKFENGLPRTEIRRDILNQDKTNSTRSYRSFSTKILHKHWF